MPLSCCSNDMNAASTPYERETGKIREMGDGGARVVAGHDPLVAERFGGPADAPGVIRITRD